MDMCEIDLGIIDYIQSEILFFDVLCLPDCPWSACVFVCYRLEKYQYQTPFYFSKNPERYYSIRENCYISSHIKYYRKKYPT